jgi:TonB-linked SusC/RagA family outer membrane protein
MEMLLQRRLTDRSRLHRYLAVGMSFLLTMVLSGTALAQQVRVTGTVTGSGGIPLRGVTVRVQGTDTRAITDGSGKYTISAASDAVLGFSALGRRPAQQGILGRSTIDVTLEPVTFLEEVTVTGYTEQRRSDITGAVASVNMEAATRQTGASVLQRLDANVSGVTVQASGSPGSRSTVRVRGVSSFQNNDPLYIVDGVPVQDTYINFLNPNDITSVQVLKDASSASIYGARASNGVIVIETTRRGITGPPAARLSMRTGIATPVRGYDDFLILDALKYHEVIRRAYTHAGLAVPTNIYGDPNNPTVPTYTYVESGVTVTASDAFGRPTSINEANYAFPNRLIMGGSTGTNWWKEVFSPAQVADVNLDISGGGDDNQYGVSFNYFDQEGTAAFNTFKRGSVRVNTGFNRGRFSFGENLALSTARQIGGVADDGFGEGGFLGKNILSQPVVPVYDIAGNFASGKAVGLGNNTNPLKAAFGAQDNVTKNHRVFGNVFGGFDFNPDLSVKSSFGFNLGQDGFAGFNPILPENSEPTFTNSINENTNQFTDWTLTNTLRYSRSMDQHGLAVVLGQEANRGTNRFITGSMANLISTNVDARYLQDALGDAATKNVTSTGGNSAMLSFFGKADYNFAERYMASVTLRKDGSSRLGPTHRWGTFPALGLGWRVSKEPFLSGNSMISDAMVRFGWGVTGNQAIPSGRIVSQFGGSRGDTYYDVGGTNAVAAGFRQTSLGNTDLKWEENTSMNLGFDVALQDGRTNVVLDLFTRETDNLLFNPPTPATAGIAAPPIVNIGAMKNTGFDFSIGHRRASWNVTLNGSRYKNEIVRIDGVQDFFYGPITTRFGNQVINKVGEPIGSFYGLIAEGMFNSPAEVLAHATQDGAAPGRLKFRDSNGDGTITLADRAIIGSPHPDFTAGLDMGIRRGLWDLSATLFGTFGNEIFDVQKEFYVFRNFSTNVREDMLTDAWMPADASLPRANWTAANPGAKYPILDQNDTFSNQLSSFYVEDGSYVRLRSLQLGYNVPPKYARWMAATRIYLQAENLFTLTGYDGLDPALPAANVFGPAGDIRDQYRGVDRGTYPTNRTFSIGLVTSF